jgi:hypothetical protein
MEVLKMPTAMRRRLLSRTAKAVIKDSKKRVRNQVDLNGNPFEARKRKRRRKMLSGLAKRQRVVKNSGTEAKIGFNQSNDARIAAKQQFGDEQTVSASSLPKGNGSKDAPAKRSQAKALIEAGYKIPRKGGKGTKKPSQKWIMENLSVGKAGAILRWLRDQDETAKTSWRVKLPARSFLGSNNEDVTRYVEKIMAQMKQEIANGAR